MFQRAIRVSATPLHVTAIGLGAVSAVTGRSAQGLESVVQRIKTRAADSTDSIDSTDIDQEFAERVEQRTEELTIITEPDPEPEDEPATGLLTPPFTDEDREPSPDPTPSPVY